MDVRIENNFDLFRDNFCVEDIKWNEMDNTYVSDAIGEEEISKWSSYCHKIGASSTYVLISAQTGRGKNHFVLKQLIPYAQENDYRILYVSNRTALDHQMRRQVADATHTKYQKATDTKDDDDYEEKFGNVTVLTYHRLLNRFVNMNNRWFEQFRYVVLDECHFFYSDALFNPHTDNILMNIVTRFTNSIRIYMTATFEDIITPIQFYEGRVTPDIYDKYWNKLHTAQWFCNNGFAYRFPRDYSNYILHFFSEHNQIVEIIKNEKKKTKWLIFVTSKSAGESLCNDINKVCANNNETVACYIDRYSRNSDNSDEIKLWNDIINKNRYDCRVLISTSVLDNGFSIYDDKVENIVICSDDRTECLQELGRLRVPLDKQVNLYLRKMNKKRLGILKQRYEDLYSILYAWYGEPLIAKGGTHYSAGDPAGVIKSLWHSGANENRGFIYFKEFDDGSLIPEINDMARWRTIRLKKQIDEMEKYLKEDSENGSMIYKANWFGLDQEKVLEYISKHDVDKSLLDYALDDLISYLDKCIGVELSNNKSDKFEEFSREFVRMYHKAFPKDGSMNPSEKRKVVKEDSINTHLDKLNDVLKNGHQYHLKENDDKTFTLIRT